MIILGDLNNRTSKEIGDEVMSKYGEYITNDNGDRLI